MRHPEGVAGHGVALDIGAGSGKVTDELKPLFEEVVTTEVSANMAKLLRAISQASYLDNAYFLVLSCF